MNQPITGHPGRYTRPTSALGQKQTLADVRVMSALPPIADIGTQQRDVRFVPKADIPRCSEDRRYSITSSALVRNVSGTVRASDLAVLRLRTNRKSVGCSNGSSAGFAPLRMRPTRAATRARLSFKSGPYDIKPPSRT